MIAFSEYHTRKLAQALIFSIDKEIFKDDLDINETLLTKNSLMALRKLVEDYSKKGVLTDYTKDGMYDVINYLRFNIVYESRTAKGIVYDFCNDMIVALNNANGVNAKDFYRGEIFKRKVVSAKELPFVLTCFTNRFLNEHIEEYNQMIASDFDVLLSHHSYFDLYDFYAALEGMALQEGYYYSLNAILSENPEIVRDELFYKRVRFIMDNTSALILGKPADIELEDSDVISSEVVKSNAKLIKRIDKIKKRYYF